MKEVLRGACVIGQSGGPTSVINASAYGVIRAALDAECITAVYAAANGIEGVLNEEFYDMSLESPEELALLPYTPSSALGSCRYKMADPEREDTDYRRILEVFRKYNVRYFFYNGGNDSMDTCCKIDRYLEAEGYKCRVIGVPKTIDNDLFGTDHCPGYGSAAKYIATSCMELTQDLGVYDIPSVIILEIMGRHAGWLAAASALAAYAGHGPDLIYLPERAFDMELFLADVKRLTEEKKQVLVAVSEGIHYADGKFVAKAASFGQDGFGHVQLGGLAVRLANVVNSRLGVKVRGIELSLLQRCASHCASKTDIEEAVLAGRCALEAAVEGKSGVMIAFNCTRENGEYVCTPDVIELERVANLEKNVPDSWINADSNGMTQEFIDYALPLIQGEPERPYKDSLPRFAALRKLPPAPVI